MARPRRRGWSGRRRVGHSRAERHVGAAAVVVRPPRAGLPSPEEPETRSVPANQGLRAHDDQCGAPCEQPGQQRQAYPRCGIDPPRLHAPARRTGRVAGAGTAPLHAATGATETPGQPTRPVRWRVARQWKQRSTRRPCHTRETEPLQDPQTGFLRTKEKTKERARTRDRGKDRDGPDRER